MFQKNINALQIINKNLANLLKTISLEDAAKNIVTTNAKSNDIVILYKNIPLDGINNPIQEAKETYQNKIPNDLEKNDLIILFGLGLGYLPKRSYISTEAKIFIYEPNIEIIRFVLEYVDFTEMFIDKRFYLTNNLNELLDKITLRYLPKDKIEILYNAPYALFAQKELLELTTSIVSLCEIKLSDVKTISNLSKIWTKNIIKNIPFLKNSCPINFLKNKFSGKTALILAAGPSLKSNINKIKANREKFVIFAVNKVIDYLYKNEITPDFIVFLDAQYIEYSFSVPLEYFKNINIISSIRAQNNTYNIKSKNHFTLFSENEPFSAILSKNYPQEIELAEGVGTAVGTAYFAAKILGFSNIIFAGLDLALKDENAYADDSKIKKISDNTIVINRMRKKIKYVKSFDNKKIPTRDDYALFIQQLSEIFKKDNQTKLYNITDFGAFIEGMEYTSLDNILTNLNIETLSSDIIYIPQSQKNSWVRTCNNIIEKVKKDFDEIVKIKKTIINWLDIYKQISIYPNLTDKCLNNDIIILQALTKNIFTEQYLEYELLGILNNFKNRNIDITEKKQFYLQTSNNFFEKASEAIDELLETKKVSFE